MASVAAPRSTVITAQGLCIGFQSDSGGHVRVLHNLNLEIVEGELLAVLGPSGCGKSTFLRVIAGLVQSHPAQLQVADKFRTNALAMSMNFQKSVLLPWLTVEQNALLPYEASGQQVDKAVWDRLNHLLNVTGLEGFRHVRPAHLSGGMQMRASLVRSLVTEPKLLLMDEPFAALDETTRTRLGFELRDLISELNTTTIFVTHSVQEAVLLADRVVTLSMRPAHITSVYAVPFKGARTADLLDSTAYYDGVAKVREVLAHD